MNEKRPSIEVIAPTVEEAIQQGLRELSLPSAAVDIDILDEGSRGIFGLGARQARIRLTIKSSGELQLSKPETLQPALDKISPAEEIHPEKELEENIPPLSDDESRLLNITENVVTKIIQEMQVKAEVKASFSQTATERGDRPIHVDIRGKDLTILIGPQAETLNALQYISGLIIGKEIGQSIPLVIDVEGYRSRRESQIRHLARKMAEQAVKTGRRQILEPMPANERRIVHLELRDNPAVSTESIGEEPRRKVTIIPK